MKLDLYQIDAFAEETFSGNPAAIVPLREWLPTEIMQKIANENNLSETAFFVKDDDFYDIKWFTPEIEVDLCGHATLAAGHVMFEHLGFNKTTIPFNSNSGALFVSKFQDKINLNFPQTPVTPLQSDVDWEAILGVKPSQVFQAGPDILTLYNSESEVVALSPNFEALKKVTTRGLIATAHCKKRFDFVSRFFGPAAGINEDPVTGSAHTALTPFWGKRLQKKAMRAKQLSKRGGLLYCQLIEKGNRVLISGKAVTYMKGEIYFNL